MSEFDDVAFIEKVRKRGAEIISVKGMSSISSAARAACDHMHDWWNGSPADESVSMAVISEGNKYGVPEDLFFSYPLFIKEGQWQIEDKKLDEIVMARLIESAKELAEEK